LELFHSSALQAIIYPEERIGKALADDETVQAVVGAKGLPFGAAQSPQLMDYADGVDVMQFLLGL
jgi:hypothetical protein